MNIRLAGIEQYNYNLEILVQGCSENCKKCFCPGINKTFGGYMFTTEAILRFHYRARQKSVIFSGGEPLFQAKPLTEIAKKYEEDGKKVICYTTFSYDEIKKYLDKLENGGKIYSLLNNRLVSIRELFNHIDVLVTERCSEEQGEIPDSKEHFTEQINMRETLKSGKKVLHKDYMKELNLY